MSYRNLPCPLEARHFRSSASAADQISADASRAAARRPWWRRRLLLVSEDSRWMSEAARAMPAGMGTVECISWTNSAEITGPIGAIVCHIDRPGLLGNRIQQAFECWSSLAWQPCTLTWIAPQVGAASVRAALSRLGFQSTCSPDFGLSLTDEDTWQVVGKRLDLAPWVVSVFAQRLSWSRSPRLVQVLSVPILRSEVATVGTWARSLGLSYGELSDLCREHGACRPKRLLDVVRLGAELARARGRKDTRALLAKRLAYSSGRYLGQRTKNLSGYTLGTLISMPVMSALDVLVELTILGSRKS